MKREYYLDLAKQNIRMPIGAHLVLCEKPNHDALILDGKGLGQVVAEAARRYRTPLAFPLMDLTVEKADLLAMLEVPANQIDAYHFTDCPPQAVLEQVREKINTPPTARMKANAEAIGYVGTQPELVAVGMSIGPFSMMTKLLADPITPVYLSGTGIKGSEDPEVRAVEIALELSVMIIERGIRHQVNAGAKAICLCEPAANMVYLSPNQLAEGSDVFERLVMVPNRRIKALMKELDCDLIFHDCGELTDNMVKDFTTLDPAVLSLGASRKLWEDAKLVPKTTVLFGNLPTKKFYSDNEMPMAKVEALTKELISNMGKVGHPYIPGSECDVLSVPGSEATIKAKVDCMMSCMV